MEEIELEFKRCLMCGNSRIKQIREAYFKCPDCGQDYIADLEDMKK